MAADRDTGADLSLRSLLSHPDTGELAVLNANDAVWRAVVTEVREADLPDHCEDSLAILIDPAPAASWQLDALLRRVHDRGFTGLALAGESVDERAGSLGARLGLAVIRTSQPTRMARACWELTEAQNALTVWTVQRVVRSIEYQALGLGDLLRHVSSNLGQSVALIGRDGVLRAAGDPPSRELLRGISFDARWLDEVGSGAEFGVSVPVPSPARQELRVLLHGRDASRAQKNAFGTAVEVIMPMVAARLLVDQVDEVADISRSSGLLGDFLESRSPDPALERRMQARGWATAGHHLGFRMTGRSRVDQLELLGLVVRELGKLQLDTHATIHSGAVTGWLTFPVVPDQSTVTRQVRALHRLHRAVSQHFGIATGVGALGSGATGLRESIGQATDAARLAADRERTGWFLQLDSLGLEQLMLSVAGGDSFARAAASLLEPLSAGEQQTLAEYLEHESSLAQTADALGLHRNTVSQRIQRIQEVLGVDLRDAEARLALQLACRARQ
jgi:purine catabolism regulator